VKPTQPTFTVVPNGTVPGTTTTAPGSATVPTPTGAGSTMGVARNDQPGFTPGTLAPGGTGKADAPGAMPPGSLAGNTGTTARPGGAPVGTGAGTNGNGFPNPGGTVGGTGLAGNTTGTTGVTPGSTTTGAGNGFNGFPPAGGTNLAGNTGTNRVGDPAGPTPTGGRSTGTPNFGSTPNGTGVAITPARVEKTHVVASGETLSAIAKKYYGSEAKWEVIRKANPMVNPNNLKVGSKLRIPDGTSLAAAPAGGSGSTGSTSTGGTATASNTSTGSGNSTHTVSSGDTLAAIARKYYGSDKFWEKIYAANKSTIGSNPANLKIGQKLSIPAKTVVVGGENVER
jgi:nucleoid-associated protein YgaU